MSTIDPRKRRLGRRPGRSGRPQRPITTRLLPEDMARLQAIVRARRVTVFAFMRDAILRAMGEINPEEYSRKNEDIYETAAALGAAGLSPRREPTERGSDGLPLPRLREKDTDARRAALGPPPGRDRPDIIW